MTTLAKPPSIPAVPGVSKESPLERRCENADCNVNKLVSMVPKRKTAQFVTEPTIIEKPMLVNGFTTIFQVDGTSAKISDLKSQSNGEPSTIYRIIPNTHAHIVNYVVVDTEGESMRKINSGDPTTMKKLLDSQRVSAEQMLTKLMTGHGAFMQISNTSVSNGVARVTMQKTSTTRTTNSPTPTSTSTPLNTMVGALLKMPNTTTAKLPMRSVTIKKVQQKLLTPPQPQPAQTPPTTISKISTPTSVPSLLHLNSSIKVRALPTKLNTSIASTTVTPSAIITKARSSAPIIKTVPLSQLQQKPTTPVLKTDLTTAPVTSTPVAPPTTVNPMFEKMQKELEELRRTVAFLAESQKKSLSNQTSTDEDTPVTKKPRLT